MSAAKFFPAIDIIRPTGGSMRVSYSADANEPAIKLEAFRKAGERGTAIGKVVISTAMLWPVLQAMVEAGNRALNGDEPDPKGGVTAISLDVANALNPGKGQRNG